MSVADHVAAVRARIAQACTAAGRDPAEVTLVGVAKKHSIQVTQEGVDAGVTHVGESYAQELVEKADAMSGVTWHFVGRLQRNKVKFVVGRAALIHAVDSLALAQAIAKRAASLDIRQAVLLAVNLGGEEQKTGVEEPELRGLFDAVKGALDVRGLMTLPPRGQDPRPVFRRLRELRDELGLKELSMGMSADLEVAIGEGATLVRVGTAIYGSRPA